MLRLLLIRHATARPALPGDADEDRPLAPEGRDEARRMGRWVAEHGLVPGAVLCSSARRTRETLALMAEGWGDVPVAHLDALYAAGPEAALELLAGEGASVALVGHNPTMGVLAETLARAPRRGGFAPCTVAALSFDAEDWAGVGAGEVVAWGTPGEVA